jgi:hypothetical protein
MGEYLDKLSDKVRVHLLQIAKSVGIPDDPETLEQMARGWDEKMESFQNLVSEKGMEELESMDKDDSRGALLITYSGSILSIGPMEETFRNVEYSSIGMRTDVPETAQDEESEIKADIAIDEPVYFLKGPIQQSSPIYRIAVMNESIAKEEQEELLSEITKVLSEDFVEVNKTIIIE